MTFVMTSSMKVYQITDNLGLSIKKEPKIKLVFSQGPMMYFSAGFSHLTVTTEHSLYVYGNNSQKQCILDEP